MSCVLLALGCSGERQARKTHLARLPPSVGTIAVADDATTYAYVDTTGEHGRVVHGGLSGPPYPGFGPLTFSPITRKLFSVKEPEERITLVADGRRCGPYVELRGYAWADDGARVAYAAAELPATHWRYYVDGEVRSPPSTAAWRPRVEAGTGRLAWSGEPEIGGRGAIGIEHRKIASFDEVVWGPTFLRPGVVTWVIRRGRWLTRIDAPAT